MEIYRKSYKLDTSCPYGDMSCRIIEGFAEGYYTKCKQKFIYHQLLAVASNGSIIPELFRFPTNCYCHIDFEFYSTFHLVNIYVAHIITIFNKIFIFIVFKHRFNVSPFTYVFFFSLFDDSSLTYNRYIILSISLTSKQFVSSLCVLSLFY